MMVTLMVKMAHAGISKHLIDDAMSRVSRLSQQLMPPCLNEAEKSPTRPYSTSFGMIQLDGKLSRSTRISGLLRLLGLMK